MTLGTALNPLNWDFFNLLLAANSRVIREIDVLRVQCNVAANSTEPMQCHGFFAGRKSKLIFIHSQFLLDGLPRFPVY